ncbi:MAG: hypothetical protein M1832_000046 [Thelocarpon impressellum]|nr:MAG: hypothetical protein M1832_000046 [Thelocarpon impressellum]
MAHRDAEIKEDLFDGLLRLEDTLYAEGYKQGEADGAKAGHVEGRAFGLEKAFEKYLAMGRLHGRATILAARLETFQDQTQVDFSETSTAQAPLPALPGSSSSRLEKHVQTLLALVDPTTLSTENTEDAVSDFDDRLKRARAKMRVIGSILGERAMDDVDVGSNEERRRQVPELGDSSHGKDGGEGNIEDIRNIPIKS